MRHRLLFLLVAAVAALMMFAGTAFARAGHFVGKPTCRDVDTTVECTGKVVGLSGSTFEVTVEAVGTASVECTSPGGEVAPGQDFSTTVFGTTSPLNTPSKRKAQFMVRSDSPSPAPGSCPNPMWEARVIDVQFTMATLTLWEGSTISDTITVPVS